MYVFQNHIHMCHNLHGRTYVCSQNIFLCLDVCSLTGFYVCVIEIKITGFEYHDKIKLLDVIEKQVYAVPERPKYNIFKIVSQVNVCSYYELFLRNFVIVVIKVALCYIVT